MVFGWVTLAVLYLFYFFPLLVGEKRIRREREQ